MTDTRTPDPVDSLPDANQDPRSDIEQAVEARADAVKRGEGGDEPDALDEGEVRNQNEDAQ